MIRWNYLLPRLLIVLLLGITIRLTVNPLCRSVITQTLQSTLDAKVHLDGSEVSFLPPQIQINHLELMNKHADEEYRNLAELDEINLKLEASALLRRQLVIENASIKGIQFNSDRIESEQTERSVFDGTRGTTQSREVLQTAIAFCENIKKVANDKIQHLNFSQEIRLIRQRWTQEFEKLNIEIASLQEDTEKLSIKRKNLSNPLRDLKQIEETLQNLSAKHGSLQRIGSSINSLPARVEKDRERLREAKDNDIADIQSSLPVPVFSNAKISVDLFSSAIEHLSNQAQLFMEHGETIAKYTVIPPKNLRSRGQNFELNAESANQPLVRAGELSGVFRHRGSDYIFSAKTENLAGNQTYMNTPCRIKLTARGHEVIKMEYAYQRKRDSRVSQITMHWPDGVTKEINFGNGKHTGISWNSDQQELWIQIRKDEHPEKKSAYSGRIINLQRNVKFDFHGLPNGDGNSLKLKEAFQQRLSSVPAMNLDASFTLHDGNWDLEIKNDLAPLLTDAISEIVKDEINQARHNLNLIVQEKFRDEGEEFREWFAKKQKEVSSKHERALQSLEQIKAALANVTEEVNVYVGRLRGANKSSLR